MVAGHQFEEEVLMQMFAPDFALPAQINSRASWAPPELRMVERFLWRNIADYVQMRIRANANGANFAKNRNQRVRAVQRVGANETATHWFHDRAWKGPFSYIWTCDMLGLDPDWLIARLESLKVTTSVAARVGRMVA